MKPVLICGGVGKKMWPLSRTNHPKHFLPLFNGKSLYQINYETLLKKFKPEEIYIQTTLEQAKIALEQSPGVPQKNCFVEPELRDHGPAMGFMAIKLEAIDPEEPFILVQTDVIREPAEKFLEMIGECETLVKKEGKLITGGFRPEYAVMGVDYLISGEKIEDAGGLNIYKVEKFLWRGVREDVEKYLSLRSIFLHANHYAWTPNALLKAYEKWAPDWFQSLQKIKTAMNSGKDEIVKEEYSKMEKGPVENVTQHFFTEGYVVEVPFKWIDFGTWESFFKYRSEKGEYNPGDNLLAIDSKNCFVQKDDNNFVALIGVNDLAVIDTDDALLICRKDQSGKVGDVVSYLKKKGKKEYL